jgi:ferritin-like metal-binding protein YciE
MATKAHDRINQYLEDTIAAERNFEAALHSFGKAGEQGPVKELLGSLSGKARTQHERLTRLLEQRGGSPSTAKTVLAEALAFSPLTAQIGQASSEKNTQHLMVTFAAAAAEMAMYETLAASASQAGDEEVASLARKLQSEEREDYEQVSSLLRSSARDSFQASSAKEGAKEILRTYVEEAIAAEKSFETQLTAFSKEGDDTTVQRLFANHAQETHLQYERLTDRLKALGGTPSVAKSFLAHLFAFSPKVAQLGHDAAERVTQNLIMAYAVENAEVSMYESLAEAARSSGDIETEQLALSIQQEEKATAEKLWIQLAPAARRSMASADTAKAS